MGRRARVCRIAGRERIVSLDLRRQDPTQMTRVAVLAIALAFILGFAFLTIGGIEQYGFSAEGVISVFVLVLLAVGILGALRNPPR
jgi:hypothetical protein